jgi:hypothetical protein
MFVFLSNIVWTIYPDFEHSAGCAALQNYAILAQPFRYLPCLKTPMSSKGSASRVSRMFVIYIV